MINYQRRSRKINSLEEFSSKFEILDGTTQKSNIKILILNRAQDSREKF